MHDTTKFIIDKFQLQDADLTHPPVEIPGIGKDDFPSLFRELGFTTGAEIGVLRGDFAEQLLEGMPELYWYGIDPYVEYEGYNSFGKNMEKNYLEAWDKLTPYRNRSVFVKSFSLDAVQEFEDESLDFVYIDGHHGFQHVVNDICEWSKKVKIGGIICGDDYIRPKRHYRNHTHHVIDVVNAFTRAYDIKPWFLLGTAEVVPGVKRDKVRNWMWVKEDNYFDFNF